MCSLRDAATALLALEARVVGVAVESIPALKAFREREGLGFPLLSDSDKRMAAAYGVLHGDSCRRETFVLDPQGVVRHVARDVRLMRHGQDMLAVLRDLKR